MFVSVSADRRYVAAVLNRGTYSRLSLARPHRRTFLRQPASAVPHPSFDSAFVG